MRINIFVKKIPFPDTAKIPLLVVEGLLLPPQQKTVESEVEVNDEDDEKNEGIDWKSALQKNYVRARFGEKILFFENSFFELMYIVQGTTLFLIDGEVLEVREGDILAINAGTPYAWITPPDSPPSAVRRVQYLPEEIFKDTNERISLATTMYYNCRYLYIPNREATNDDLIVLINELLYEYRNRDMGRYNLLFSYLMQISIKIARAKFPYICRRLENMLWEEGNFKKVLDYIHKNFSRPLSLAEVSGIASMSKNYFCGYFKKKIGMSLNEYVMYLRIMKASDLLKNSKYNITEIIGFSGFDSHAQFYREFRRIHHTTPTEFKKRKGKTDHEKGHGDVSD